MQSKMKLYSYFRSSSAYRVRIALNLKNIDYEYKAVHLVDNGGEQNSPEFQEQNPMMQVPSLEIDGKFINQSLAILLYLEDTAPNQSLFPADSFEKSKVIELCEIINIGIQPIQNLKVLQYVTENSSIEKGQWGKHWIENGFVSFEKAIERTSKGFCFGDTPTAADCYLIPQVYNANRFKVDMTKFQKINSVYEKCMELDAFKNAQPSAQPDAPS